MDLFPIGTFQKYISNLILYSESTFGSDISNLADEVELAIGHPFNGCSSMKNDVAHKVVLLERGDCQFTEKVHHAQFANAKGVIVMDVYPMANGSLYVDHY